MPPIQSETLIRSGTTAEWADADASDNTAAPVLGEGEVGIDTDTGVLRVGDGTSAFAALPSGGLLSGRVVLVAGEKTVLTAEVGAKPLILTSVQATGTVATPQPMEIFQVVAGESFTIKSADATDTSQVAWAIIHRHLP